MPRKSKQSPSEKGTVMEGSSRRLKRKKGDAYPMPQIGRVPGSNRYELEAIVDYRLSPAIHSPDSARPGAKRAVYFVVRWAGYSDKELTLEPAVNLLEKSHHTLNEFLRGKGLKLEMNPATEETWLSPLIAKENTK